MIGWIASWAGGFVPSADPMESLLTRLDALAAASFECVHEAHGWRLVGEVGLLDSGYRRFVDPEQVAFRISLSYSDGRFVAAIDEWQWGDGRRQSLYFDGAFTGRLSHDGRDGSVYEKYFGGGVGPMCTTFCGVHGATPIAVLIRDARATGRLDCAAGADGSIVVTVPRDSGLPGFRIEWNERSEVLRFSGIDSGLDYTVMQWSDLGGLRVPNVIVQRGRVMVALASGAREQVEATRLHKLSFSAELHRHGAMFVKMLEAADCVSIRGVRRYSWSGIEEQLNRAATALAGSSNTRMSAVLVDGRPAGASTQPLGEKPDATAGGRVAADERWPSLARIQKEIYVARGDAQGLLKGYCAQSAASVVSRLLGSPVSVQSLIDRQPEAAISLGSITKLLEQAGLGAWEIVAMTGDRAEAVDEVAIMVPMRGSRNEVHHAFVFVPGGDRPLVWESERQQVRWFDSDSDKKMEWACVRRVR